MFGGCADDQPDWIGRVSMYIKKNKNKKQPLTSCKDRSSFRIAMALMRKASDIENDTNIMDG